VTTNTDNDSADAGDVPWLSPDEERDWRDLMALLMTLPLALDAQLKRDSAMNSFEFHVLANLSEAPERTLPLSDLAVKAQGSLSRLSHAITRLERTGWVERRACAEHARRVEARLTDAGMAKVQETAPAHVREARRLVVDVLTPDERAALGRASRAIIAATCSPGDAEGCPG
jgi:DNA-binding MarR family transcriptional regulator